MHVRRRTVLHALAGSLAGLGAGCTTGTNTEDSPVDDVDTTATSATATSTAAATTTNTSSKTEGTTTTESSTTADTSTASVAVEPEETTVAIEGYDAMVRLDATVSGGSTTEVDWSALDQPDGASVGILDYDEYAKVQVDTPGEYAIQVTATFESGTRARDVATIHATESTTTTEESTTRAGFRRRARRP